MGKLLLWVIVILVVMMLLRIASARAAAKRRDAAPGGAPARRPGAQSVESMVRCAHCGIHLPRSEALQINGKVWCSNDHARLGER